MNGGRLERWSPVAGIAFAVLFLLSTAVFASGIPGPEDSDETIVSYYGDSGNQVQAELAYFALTLGAVLFLWFAGTLSANVRRLEGDAGWLSRITLASATAFTTVLIIGSALAAMVPDVSNDSDTFRLDPDTVRLLTDASYTLVFETALPLAAPLVFAVSFAVLRTKALPRWFGWAGVVVAVSCLVGFLGVPMGLFLLWTVVVAAYQIRRFPLDRASPDVIPS